MPADVKIPETKFLKFYNFNWLERIYNDLKKVRDKYEHFRARCSRKQPKKSSRKRRKEKGCVDPLMGRKLKCVIDVVPKNSRRRSFRFYKPMA